MHDLEIRNDQAHNLDIKDGQCQVVLGNHILVTEENLALGIVDGADHHQDLEITGGLVTVVASIIVTEDGTLFERGPDPLLVSHVETQTLVGRGMVGIHHPELVDVHVIEKDHAPEIVSL